MLSGMRSKSNDQRRSGNRKLNLLGLSGTVCRLALSGAEFGPGHVADMEYRTESEGLEQSRL